MAISSTVIGGDTDPTILGTIYADTIHGTGGNDLIDGDNGNDLLFGEAGNDGIFGGAGADTLNGGSGIDSMEGGTGNDVYIVDSGYDAVIEGSNAGIDEVRVGTLGYARYGYYDPEVAPAGWWSLEANVENLTYTGTNWFFGYGNELGNVIKAGAASYAEMYAGAGNDTIFSGDGTSIVYGGVGNDVMYLGGGADTGYGGDGNDSMDGGSGNDILIGGLGADTLVGGTGDDYLATDAKFVEKTWYVGDLNYWYVATGAWPTELNNDFTVDLLQGGAGNDTLLGFAGDTLAGGANDDAYMIHGGSRATISEAANAGSDTVWLYDSTYFALGANVENLRLDNSGLLVGGRMVGNDLANFMQGSAFGDTLQGGLGNDTLLGRDGSDRVDGGAGDDWICGDRINFSTLADASDTLLGGAGNDRLFGGGGADLLRGDAGADLFIFDLNANTAAVRDQVLDFQRGLDKIDLSMIDPNNAVWGDQAFVLAAGPAAGAVWQQLLGNGKVAVFMDTNGDAVADMGVDVAFGDGLAPALLQASDFVF